MRRWDYKYNHIEDVISNNSLGKLQTIIASGNTSLLTSACHLIDLMLMYGKDEDWVVGDLQQDYIRNVDGIQDYGGSAMIKFKSGVCGFLKFSNFKWLINAAWCPCAFVEQATVVDPPLAFEV